MIGRWWAIVWGPILAGLLAAAGFGEDSELGQVDVAVLTALALTIGIAVGVSIRRLVARS